MTMEEKLDKLEKDIAHTNECLGVINENLGQIIDVLIAEGKLQRIERLKKVLGARNG